MKQTGKFFLLVAFLFTSIATAQAQPSFILPNLTVDQGTSFNVDMTVASFEDIITMQFTVEWNPAVLQFQEVEDFGLTDLDLPDFGVSPSLVEQGKLTLAWSPEVPINGFSLEDSTILFSIKFLPIGNAGDTTSIVFSDDPTLREIADSSLSPIENVGYESGFVTVMGPSSVVVLGNNKEAISNLKSFPNPFTTSTQFQFELRQPTQVNLTIQNVHGQVIFEETNTFSAGPNILTFDNDVFLEKGIYYLNMKAPDFSVTQKWIYL